MTPTDYPTRDEMQDLENEIVDATLDAAKCQSTENLMALSSARARFAVGVDDLYAALNAEETRDVVACEDFEQALNERDAARAALASAQRDTVRLAALEGLLNELSVSGVEFDDKRISYVSVQIERTWWNDLCRLADAKRLTAAEVRGILADESATRGEKA